jgi:aryl-alcohol dehydrogenase-like predicted oxidoreductase
MARALGIAVTAWSPLASGLLTGKYLQKEAEERRLDKAPSFQQMSHRNAAIAKLVVQIAKENGKSPAQVALNWLRSRGAIIPILGARKLAQFEDNMGCLSWSLDEQQSARLEEVSRIELGFPTDFLHRREVRDFLHGGLFDRIRPT